MTHPAHQPVPASPVPPPAEQEPGCVHKSLAELTREDMEAIASYSTDTAYALGKQDFHAGRTARRNPFPRDFMRGVPHDSFATYYEHGWQLAKAMSHAASSFRQLSRHDMSQPMSLAA